MGLDLEVPFANLRPISFMPDSLHEDMMRAVGAVIESGIYLNGPWVEVFEQKWAEACGAPYCVSCGTGTAALTIAARAYLQKFKGQVSHFEIQANTCPFTLTGIGDGSSVPIDIVDVSPADGWPAEYTKHTIPVLLYGRDVPEYNVCCPIVDACQAHGMAFRSDVIACWSFYPTKNLGTAGDGGAITLHDAGLAEMMRPLAAQIPSRLSELNAAVLVHKLRMLRELNGWRRKVAGMYWDNLPADVVSVCQPDDQSNLHIFPILTERRDTLAEYLKTRGIGTKVHYPIPLNHNLPGASSWARRILSLPIYPGLTRQQVSHVCRAIKEFFK